MVHVSSRVESIYDTCSNLLRNSISLWCRIFKTRSQTFVWTIIIVRQIFVINICHAGKFCQNILYTFSQKRIYLLNNGTTLLSINAIRRFHRHGTPLSNLNEIWKRPMFQVGRLEETRIVLYSNCLGQLVTAKLFSLKLDNVLNLPLFFLTQLPKFPLIKRVSDFVTLCLHPSFEKFSNFRKEEEDIKAFRNKVSLRKNCGFRD